MLLFNNKKKNGAFLLLLWFLPSLVQSSFQTRTFLSTRPCWFLSPSNNDKNSNQQNTKMGPKLSTNRIKGKKSSVLPLQAVHNVENNDEESVPKKNGEKDIELTKNSYQSRELINNDNDTDGLMKVSSNDYNKSDLPSNNDEKSMKLDWKTIQQQMVLFRQMAWPYYQESIAGRWLLGGVLVLTLMNSGVAVMFSYLSKDFWNALNDKDAQEFYVVLRNYLIALALGAPIVTFYKFQREQMAVHWREWMTARTVSLYTNHRVYYQLEMNKTIDNPDQRIAEDVKTFTGYSLQFLITILTSLIDLGSFSFILWSIYPQLFGAIILYAAMGTLITTFLGQSLVGLNFWQLQREADLRYVLVRWRDNAESIAFYAGEDLEGQAVERRLEAVLDNQRKINVVSRNLEFFTNSYKYLIQIVPVAVVAPKYFAGEIALGIISQSVGAFNHILSDLSIIVTQFEKLSSFSAGIERLATFYDAIRLADSTSTSNGTTSLLAMSNGEAERLSSSQKSIESYIDSSLQYKLHQDNNNNTAIDGIGKDTNGKDAVPKKDTIVLRRVPFYAGADNDAMRLHNNKGDDKKNVVLSLQNLDLYTPDQKRMLVRNLSLQLFEGQHLLVVGNSGAGKSSLLRGLAGLWIVGRGFIDLPPDEDVYFLPQRPYCTLGSLRDQLLYPLLDYEKNDMEKPKARDEKQKILPRAHFSKMAWTDEGLLDILSQVDLIDVARRAGDGDAKVGLHVIKDWTNVLSLGEQQRLAFGRLLVNQPKLVILDEATSALDLVAERRMYTLLQNMSARETTKGNYNGGSSLGLTYISVGHRPSLLAYHDKRLRLAGPDEPFELSDIEKTSVQLPSSIQNL